MTVAEIAALAHTLHVQTIDLQILYFLDVYGLLLCYKASVTVGVGTTRGRQTLCTVSA